MGEPRYIPPRESFRVAGFFERWCRTKMLAKKFGALRIERESMDLIRSVASDPGPLIVAANHIGWWDPLTMHTMHRRCMPGRSMRAPMDADQLERFKIFRKLGVFGIDPDDPRSLELMATEMRRYFAEVDRPTLWITPQGKFADAREPIVVRPGVSKLAASVPGVRVLTMSIEYCFWTDPKPEILIGARLVEGGPDSTTSWQRAISQSMSEGAEALRAWSIARDPDAFVNLFESRSKQGGVFYDFWLRVRGKGGAIAARREQEQHAGGVRA